SPSMKTSSNANVVLFCSASITALASSHRPHVRREYMTTTGPSRAEGGSVTRSIVASPLPMTTAEKHPPSLHGWTGVETSGYAPGLLTGARSLQEEAVPVGGLLVLRAASSKAVHLPGRPLPGREGREVARLVQ